MKKNPKKNVNRRHFLKSSGKVAAASAVLSQMPIERVAHAAVGDTAAAADAAVEAMQGHFREIGPPGQSDLGHFFLS